MAEPGDAAEAPRELAQISTSAAAAPCRRPPPPTISNGLHGGGGGASASNSGMRETPLAAAAREAEELQEAPSASASESGTAPQRSPAGSADSRSEGARFWKPAIGRLFEVYLERRLQDVLQIFLRLDVLHWRHLLEFFSAFRGFLKHTPSDDLPPPALPADVLAYIGTAYISGHSDPPAVSELTEPLWYIEAMVNLRLLLGTSSSRGSESGVQEPGLPVPPLVVQFLVHTCTSSAFAALLFTAGVRGHEAAWARHGGDVLLAMQHVILRLYPEDARAALAQGSRPPVLPNEVPCVASILVSTALQFSAHLLLGSSSSGGQEWCKAVAEDILEAAPPASDGPLASRPNSPFPAVLRCLGFLNQAAMDTRRVGDKFLLCLGDVLRQLLGPAPRTPRDLPAPVPPVTNADDQERSTSLDIKELGRIVRTILHAHSTDPARLAAREAGRRQSMGHGGEEASQQLSIGVELLSAGSFAGPSEPGDFVPVQDQGPLRRSLVFMEQSALLHVVQSKLCAANFSDVVGATDQLSMFALRNINVLWFDLRRCTSTLKQDLGAQHGDTLGEKGGASLLLVLRNLRLGLAPNWEAKLAKFPYLSLSGASRVVVKSLVISIRFSVSYGSGLVLNEVDVGTPELDIQLLCTSTLSQIILSVVLEILQNTLKEHIQKQLHKNLVQMLHQEFDKMNVSVWRFLAAVIPERLISRSLRWIGSNIPPEGLPI